MKNQHTNDKICKCCLAYRKGMPIRTLITKFHVPRSTIYYWIKKYKDLPEVNPEHYLNIIQQLGIEKQHKERLQAICEILQKVNCTINSPLKVKLYEAALLYGQYTIQQLSDALQINRTTLTHHIRDAKKENAWWIIRKTKLQQEIQYIYDENNGIYGAKKIHALLKRHGQVVTLKYVKQLMFEMNLKSCRDTMKSEFLRSSRKKKKNIATELFKPKQPNELWVGDITQFHFHDFTFYICVIIDIFSRKIVGYKISNRSSTQLTTSTFRLAYIERKPTKLIFHSDRGCQYVSYAYRKLLANLQVEQSFSRPRTPGDNSVVESFFASLKKEELYRKTYISVKQFKNEINNYIIFYNKNRPQKFLGYLSPDEWEENYNKSNQKS